MTLLELTIVLAILASVSFMTLGLVESNTDQIWYDDTKNRMDMIKRAIVGEPAANYHGQKLMSGFVFDNGLLPTNIDELINLPANFDSREALKPRFDSDPVASGINDDAGTIIVDENGNDFILFKGYRNDGYINLPAGVTEFKDGWGALFNVTFNDDDGDGTNDEIITESYGKDNNDGVTLVGIEADPYENDVENGILANDWQIDVAGLTVKVANYSGSDIGRGVNQCLRVSLLVYINNNNPADELNWKRLTSHCISGNASTIGAGSCLDSGLDGLVDSMACPQSATVSFPAGGFSFGASGTQPITLIPQGRHVVLLVEDTDSNDAHNNTSETQYLSGGNGVVAIANFYANTSLPSVTLVIR